MSSVSLAWPGSVSLGVAALLLPLPSQRIVWATEWCPSLEGQVSAELCSFWRLQERIHFLAFSTFQKAAHIPRPMASSQQRHEL